MPGLYSWVVDSVTYVSDTIKYVKDVVVAAPVVANKVVTQAYQLGKQFYQSPQLRQATYDRAKGYLQGVVRGLGSSAKVKAFWKAFTRNLDVSILHRFMDSKKSRTIYFQSIYDNTVNYILPVTIYLFSIRNALRSRFDGMENSYAEMALDTLATLYFVRKSVDMYISNTMYNAALSKAIADQVKDDEAAKAKQALAEDKRYVDYFKPCECGVAERFKANVASTSYYFGNMLTAKMVADMVPLGKYIAIPIRAYFSGLGLIEYRYSNKCTEHRYEYLSKNNMYAFGYGASLIATTMATSTLLYYVTGVHSYFIDDALYNMLYQYFMVSATLINKPIPEDERTHDLTYLNRLAQQAFFRHSAKPFITSIFSSEQCDIVTVTAAPNKETLDSLPITANAAYVRVKDKQRELLFYVNKPRKECVELNVDHIATFDTELEVASLTQAKAKRLTEAQLTTITLLTGHYHLLMKKYLNRLAGMESAKYLKRLLVDADTKSQDDFYSYERFKHRRAVNLYRETWSDTVLAAIDGIEKSRADYKPLGVVSTYFPWLFREGTRNTLNMLLDPKMQKILTAVKAFYETDQFERGFTMVDKVKHHADAVNVAEFAVIDKKEEKPVVVPVAHAKVEEVKVHDVIPMPNSHARPVKKTFSKQLLMGNLPQVSHLGPVTTEPKPVIVGNDEQDTGAGVNLAQHTDKNDQASATQHEEDKQVIVKKTTSVLAAMDEESANDFLETLNRKSRSRPGSELGVSNDKSDRPQVDSGLATMNFFATTNVATTTTSTAKTSSQLGL